jgi:hypothetical protein
MTTFFYNLYERPCNYCQAFFDSHIPEISQDFVKTNVRSFVYSFAVSILLFGGNPISSLIGSSLAVVATTIHVICMTLMRNLNIYLSHRFNKPLTPIGSEGKYCAMLLAFGGTLYLGHALSLALNLKATFYATIPFQIFTLNTQQTPLFGMII